ncbi:GntR family transcriptional regulator [Rhodococcus opacus]|uniref:GntR family transcriptional regulator n=1 Tax=Rhodococcus opacus TaxID=37919 RepID=UPI00155B1167|nr:GntR family transcriptional regulator [Rhodococcus opacus]
MDRHKQPAPARRVTAQQLALEHIRELVVSGKLKPDARIRQEQLAAELGTSVIPVREALKTLEAEGQVRYTPHKGYQVARLRLEELTETYLIRRLLEDEIVRIAAPALDAGHYAKLDALMRTMEGASVADDPHLMISANRDFHFTIFGAARQPRMEDFIRMLWQSTDAYRSVYYADRRSRERVNEEHASIVAALRVGDVDRAVQELDEHRSHAVAALAVWLAD